MTIDTHVHLDAAAFADDLVHVVQRAVVAGVTQMITIGTDLPSSRQAVELTLRFSGVWASVGIHPHEAAHCPDTVERELMALASNARVVAIGETGLDFYRNLAPPAAQHRVFERHIALAHDLHLPLVVHSRNADAEVMETLVGANAQRVVMHCFSGDRLLAQRCLDRGWYLAFGGAVTYPRNIELRAVVGDVPDEQLLFETDAPYLAPVPHRGQRNEPALVNSTISLCAGLRHTSAEALSDQAARNAAALFTRLTPTQTEEA